MWTRAPCKGDVTRTFPRQTSGPAPAAPKGTAWQSPPALRRCGRQPTPRCWLFQDAGKKPGAQQGQDGGSTWWWPHKDKAGGRSPWAGGSSLGCASVGTQAKLPPPCRPQRPWALVAGSHLPLSCQPRGPVPGCSTAATKNSVGLGVPRRPPPPPLTRRAGGRNAMLPQAPETTRGSRNHGARGLSGKHVAGCARLSWPTALCVLRSPRPRPLPAPPA